MEGTLPMHGDDDLFSWMMEQGHRLRDRVQNARQRYATLRIRQQGILSGQTRSRILRDATAQPPTDLCVYSLDNLRRGLKLKRERELAHGETAPGTDLPLSENRSRE
jgi:hypothetical protein